ncbi:hypothetical protein Lepto7376_0009 [[Leptolyngbya] sp. PCC 7376]|uniref:CHAT domain-containing protein n=1 Tax=[Leptolyngbya] sp. PCC 7376 TaxID=111781 RepID=UPI00029F4CC1|nr:CHAT domain-containing protein [[Leptolyngbya] sp. PCC 7376]AFY36471.1 hypothetical protein Lepto7376_0009 [[Leptolyngbya] sp. PCC 7376]
MAFVRLYRLIICFTLSCLLAIAVPWHFMNPTVMAQTNPFYDSIMKMESDWQQEYENYFNTNFKFEAMDVRKMSAALQENAKLTGERTALIWIMTSGDQINLSMLTPNHKPVSRTTLVNKAEIISTKMDFFRGVTSQHPIFRNSYLKSAQTLYDWIIKPIAATLDIEEIDNLLFCTGPGLRTIPFGALHDGKEFLVEKYGVGVVPAFQLMTKGASRIGDRPALAMGASTFDELPDLPGVEIELDTIIPNLRQGKTFLNEGFTLENLKQERAENNYGIVHLATHAEFQSGTPDNSYIQFADERLTLDKMDQLNWRNPPVELLVLSACRTALGDEEAELGFAGLALQSGVRAVIASLWYVSDAASVTLMSEFYQALSQETTKISALRQAQLAMIHKEYEQPSPELAQLTRSAFKRESGEIDFSHPYYWAAYSLIGNPW